IFRFGIAYKSEFPK
ncbi:hypothetical protein Zm00014a_013848, partial [Zea mays]